MTEWPARREARPDEVQFELVWDEESDGGLCGRLEVRNVGAEAFRLFGKPQLDALGLDGASLGARCLTSTEGRIPGFVELAPGERAGARVWWAGWDGSAASGRFVVRWCPDGSAELEAQGSRQPRAVGPATNLSADWWNPLEGEN